MTDDRSKCIHPVHSQGHPNTPLTLPPQKIPQQIVCIQNVKYQQCWWIFTAGPHSLCGFFFNWSDQLTHRWEVLHMFYSNSSQGPPLDITVCTPSTQRITNLVHGMHSLYIHLPSIEVPWCIIRAIIIRPKDLLLSEPPSTWSVCINPDVNAAAC